MESVNDLQDLQLVDELTTRGGDGEAAAGVVVGLAAAGALLAAPLLVGGAVVVGVGMIMMRI